MNAWLAEAARQIAKGETGKKFSLFYELLCERNRQFNLTRITDEEECRVKHFLDSVMGAPFFPQGARAAEVGSGGGFPSIPLMIVRPDLSFTLFESVGKKCAFLKEATDALGLCARVVNARAEDAAKEKEFRERFDICCARAVAPLSTLAEYCLPLVRRGGTFVAYKGRAEGEIAAAEHAFSVLGARPASAERYALPAGMGGRTLVIAEKIRPTPPAYPRGRGKERSDPL